MVTPGTHSDMTVHGFETPCKLIVVGIHERLRLVAPVLVHPIPTFVRSHVLLPTGTVQVSGAVSVPKAGF